MGKKIFLSVMCLVALTIQAQKIAVLEFEAAKGISVSEVDGISSMFQTYFHPAGYTLVDRNKVKQILDEQGFQHSKATQEVKAKLGEVLNISKVVVGTVSKLGGKYQVDVRVDDVERSDYSVTEGATFTGDFRTHVRDLATRVAAKIAINPGRTIQGASQSNTSPKNRSTVETLYGYLKIFPNELGVFQAEPTSVISQINKQAQHGYNNWRIPTNEELSLMKANNYLSNGEYMTRENSHGIVLLVTDGDDYQTVKAKEKEREAELARIQAKMERQAEQARIKAERRAQLIDEGWVDLGLPSGTLWKSSREDNSSKENGLYTYDQAIQKYGDHIPTAEQTKELLENCKWEGIRYSYSENYIATGPNGNTLYFPAKDNCWIKCDGKLCCYDPCFWTSTLFETSEEEVIFFSIDNFLEMDNHRKSDNLVKTARCNKFYVRLVYNL